MDAHSFGSIRFCYGLYEERLPILRPSTFMVLVFRTTLRLFRQAQRRKTTLTYFAVFSHVLCARWLVSKILALVLTVGLSGCAVWRCRGETCVEPSSLFWDRELFFVVCCRYLEPSVAYALKCAAREQTIKAEVYLVGRIFPGSSSVV